MTTAHQPDTKDTFGVALGEIRSDVKHLITSMENSRTDLKEHRHEIRDALSNQDKRITRLEQFQWKMAGIIATISMVVPLIITVVVKAFGI
jgi:hypothetical protein